MLSQIDFIRKSIETNLFFTRIMKEHAILMKAALPPKYTCLAAQTECFRVQYGILLAEALRLSRGLLGAEAAMSGEYVTPFTLAAEQKTQDLTGVRINTYLTQAEIAQLNNPQAQAIFATEEEVSALINRAAQLTAAFIRFKCTAIANVSVCQLFTYNYPLQVEHLAREANHYVNMLRMLKDRDDIDSLQEMAYQEAFWNDIMGEHAEFIRGFLDPTEKALFNTADEFAEEFRVLTARAKEADAQAPALLQVTRESIEATENIRDFKAEGTQGLIQCKIKSIMAPLLGDHVLRETNHYLRSLKEFQKR